MRFSEDSDRSESELEYTTYQQALEAGRELFRKEEIENTSSIDPSEILTEYALSIGSDPSYLDEISQPEDFSDFTQELDMIAGGVYRD